MSQVTLKDVTVEGKVTVEKEAARKKFIIYTDGSFRRPSYGAWAAIILDENRKELVELSGVMWDTTINRMELMAIIEAVTSIDEPADIDLYSDSLYCVKSIVSWIKVWRDNDWKNWEDIPIKNADMMKTLWDLMQKHTIIARHVYGHSGDEFNEKCDKIAQDLTRKMISGEIKRD